MKVCFIVCSNPTGVAGHHYSARDIGLGLRSCGCNVSYLELADNFSVKSKALGPMGAMYIKVSPFAIGSLLQVRNYLKGGNFDAVFCFDETGVRITIIAVPEWLDRIVPVKPGWVNSKSWTGATKHFVCFSGENYDYMKLQKKYQKVRFHLIPNRVVPVESDLEIISKCQSLINSRNKRILMLVARIDPYKKPIFKQGLLLYRYLRKVDKQFHLVIAGVIDCQETYKWLQGILDLDDNVDVITSTSVTANIAKIFSVAEAVVANGRTAMEAMSLGKVVFIPGNSGFPVLVQEGVFNDLIYSNFTHRFKINPKQSAENLQQIKDYANNSAFVELLEHSTKTLFDNRLSVYGGAGKYKNVVHEIILSPKRVFNLSVWFFSYLRYVAIRLKKRCKRFNENGC